MKSKCVETCRSNCTFSLNVADLSHIVLYRFDQKISIRVLARGVLLFGYSRLGYFYSGTRAWGTFIRVLTLGVLLFGYSRLRYFNSGTRASPLTYCFL